MNRNAERRPLSARAGAPKTSRVGDATSRIPTTRDIRRLALKLEVLPAGRETLGDRVDSRWQKP